MSKATHGITTTGRVVRLGVGLHLGWLIDVHTSLPEWSAWVILALCYCYGDPRPTAWVRARIALVRSWPERLDAQHKSDAPAMDTVAMVYTPVLFYVAVIGWFFGWL